MSTRCSSSESTHPPMRSSIFFCSSSSVSVEVLEPITGFKVQQRSGVRSLLHPAHLLTSQHLEDPYLWHLADATSSQGLGGMH